MTYWFPSTQSWAALFSPFYPLFFTPDENHQSLCQAWKHASCYASWDMNYFLVNYFLVMSFGQVTDRQKAVHMSPLCISTGVLKNVVLKVYVFFLIFYLHGRLFQTHPPIPICTTEKNVQINGRPLRKFNIATKRKLVTTIHRPIRKPWRLTFHTWTYPPTLLFAHTGFLWKQSKLLCGRTENL